ncbi:SRPBCC family protein [Amycolatopsis rhabdoformis]|uniref:SRPBCC family protein n=1 Tax=Amycolatopsis rhabdoformis TaxID=1448059 RepID=A0ABZ1HZ72_9PSEU|nr:SRPBCC family protein [Amycolatopsis rhabdoformis]WSE26931.1 SRPBCC family protein [Amycolatopsis rhabdoformis]
MAHYEYEHTETTTAPASAVWPLWTDTARWPEWDIGLHEVELSGPFRPGTSGTMTMPDRPPIPFTLTAVEEGRAFTDETRLPDATLVFEHRLDETAGGTRITYRVTVDGPAELGPAVTEDTADAMRALARLAEASLRA